MVRVGHQVVGHDGDLPAAARRVDDVLRYRVAGGVAAKALHDLQALADRRPEMTRTLHEVALVDVVRPDPDLHELLDQVTLDVHAVVDAGQEHRLVAQRNAGPRQAVARARQLGRDLVGVVDVDVQPDRVVLREHLAQLVVDALREEYRHPAADPDDLHVGDLAQAAQHRFQELRGEREAVTAGDQHVADLGRPPDVVELGLVILAVEVLARVAHDPAPRAVAAVAGALRRDQHQDPVGVAMDQARHRRVAILGQRVLHHAGEGAQLAAGRDDLAADRVVRVVRVDEADEVGGHVHPELVGGGEALALVVGEVQDPLDLGEVVDAVGELPAPVVPLRVRHVLPDRRSPAHSRPSVRAQASRGIAEVDERSLFDPVRGSRRSDLRRIHRAVIPFRAGPWSHRAPSSRPPRRHAPDCIDPMHSA